MGLISAWAHIRIGITQTLRCSTVLFSPYTARYLYYVTKLPLIYEFTMKTIAFQCLCFQSLNKIKKIQKFSPEHLLNIPSISINCNCGKYSPCGARDLSKNRHTFVEDPGTRHHQPDVPQHMICSGLPETLNGFLCHLPE